MTDLTDDERTLLSIEKSFWQYAGIKEQVVRERLGISMVTFYQRLNAMLSDPRTEAAEPVIIHRLQRLRDTRKRSRATGRHG